jgi:hypothetical protein
MADLLEHDDTVEQEGHGRECWMMDSEVGVLLAEVEGIIADRLGWRDTLNRRCWRRSTAFRCPSSSRPLTGWVSSSGAARGGSGSGPERNATRSLTKR